MRATFLFSLLVSAVQATKVLLPLYLDPSQGGAGQWSNVYAAITANPGVQFQIIINPHSGPGNTKAGYNSDYITGVAKLNSYPNVHTFGYVRTGYGSRTTTAVGTDIARWANWNTYTASNITIRGIFFDEVPNYSGRKGVNDVAFMAIAQAAAKLAFVTIPTFQTIYNTGTKSTHAEYFTNMADQVCVFEDEADDYSNAVLTSAIPAGMASKTCVLLIDYLDSGLPAANVSVLLKYFAQLGVGSANILNYGYDESNVADAPADIGSVAQMLASS